MSRLEAAEWIAGISIALNVWHFFEISKLQKQVEKLKAKLWGAETWNLILSEANFKLRQSKEQKLENRVYGKLCKE